MCSPDSSIPFCLYTKVTAFVLHISVETKITLISWCLSPSPDKSFGDKFLLMNHHCSSMVNFTLWSKRVMSFATMVLTCTPCFPRWMSYKSSAINKCLLVSFFPSFFLSSFIPSLPFSLPPSYLPSFLLIFLLPSLSSLSSLSFLLLFFPCLQTLHTYTVWNNCSLERAHQQIWFSYIFLLPKQLDELLH